MSNKSLHCPAGTATVKQSPEVTTNTQHALQVDEAVNGFTVNHGKDSNICLSKHWSNNFGLCVPLEPSEHTKDSKVTLTTLMILLTILVIKIHFHN